MKTAIVNFANGRYIAGQNRLLQSLLITAKFEGTFLSWTKEVSIGSPLHTDNPYAFKIYGFEQAFKNFDYVLWLDASVWAIKSVAPVFEHIEKYGYIQQEAGQFAGHWANDNCLNYFGINRDEAMKMLCYGNAGFLGLSKHDKTAMEFFKRWKESMLAGAFKGAWTNENNSESRDPRCKGHRHDLVCGSIIANQLGMEYQNGEEWLNYGTEPKSDKVYFMAKGM